MERQSKIVLIATTLLGCVASHGALAQEVPETQQAGQPAAPPVPPPLKARPAPVPARPLAAPGVPAAPAPVIAPLTQVAPLPQGIQITNTQTITYPPTSSA